MANELRPPSEQCLTNEHTSFWPVLQPSKDSSGGGDGDGDGGRGRGGVGVVENESLATVEIDPEPQSDLSVRKPHRCAHTPSEMTTNDE